MKAFSTPLRVVNTDASNLPAISADSSLLARAEVTSEATANPATSAASSLLARAEVTSDEFASA